MLWLKVVQFTPCSIIPVSNGKRTTPGEQIEAVRHGWTVAADSIEPILCTTVDGERVSVHEFSADLPQVAETGLIKGTALASGDDRLLMLGAELRCHRRD
jgi:hypothetical protein